MAQITDHINEVLINVYCDIILLAPTDLLQLQR